MGKNKMIAKSCPKCEMQVAVASKSCKCGHTFFAARRGADHLARIGDTSGGDDLRRRTARVRRSQTQFYDASYQKKRRSPKKRSLSETHDESYKGKEKESGAETIEIPLCDIKDAKLKTQLYPTKLPISLQKYNDLKKLVDKNVTPRMFGSEYLNLKHDKKTKDVLNATDEEDNRNEEH